jgi:hypothetical protein
VGNKITDEEGNLISLCKLTNNIVLDKTTNNSSTTFINQTSVHYKIDMIDFHQSKTTRITKPSFYFTKTR